MNRTEIENHHVGPFQLFTLDCFSVDSLNWDTNLTALSLHKYLPKDEMHQNFLVDPYMNISKGNCI